MKHFRLNIILLLLGLVALSACLGILLAGGGHTLLVSAVALAIAVLVAWLIHILRQLVRLMSSFVSALSNSDFMIRFPDSDDRELREMFAAMNDITGLYRHVWHLSSPMPCFISTGVAPLTLLDVNFTATGCKLYLHRV